MPEQRKICVLCKHFHIDLGEPDWSDVTPGHFADVGCRKDHWEFSAGDGMTREQYREAILTAETCPDFEGEES